ncbi:diacylglycerol kinase family protein [Propionicicella superfundia]|uniref:diacylglycerol kinase family protein n=1 Tax=Propionicicella superfundia TaxID=348582 RepID=UPI000421535A|nr:diacylglycerol kinase family protein [Propionicicella superfundia]
MSWKRALPATAALVAFCAWTILLGRGAWADLDAACRLPPLTPASAVGQIAAAVSLVTWPGVSYLGLVLLALWAYRRRLSRLAITTLVAGALSWALHLAVAYIVARPRPPGALPLITSTGYSYPSGHLTAATTLLIMAVVAVAVTRQPRRVRRWVALGGYGALLIVTAAQSLVHAGRVSDLVGGFLLGATVAIGIVTVSDLRPEFLPRRRPSSRGRCVVVVNPAKVEDWATFRRYVTYEADHAGWRVAWVETSTDEGTAELVSEALRSRPGLVVAAGGDGTVREVSSALAGRDVALGILPLGTGNLLARNLAIPLDVQDAARVAFGPTTRRMDLVRLTADERPPEHFAVMGGMGIDAALMNATNAELKRLVGPAAYVLAAPQVLTTRPFSCRIAMDGSEEVSTTASMVLVGNVGSVMGQIQLLPDALPDDGVLDVVIASPQRVADWARIAGRVISGADDPAELARASGQRVTIEIEGGPVEYQLDGDTVGTCSRVVAEVVPAALTVKVP